MMLPLNGLGLAASGGLQSFDDANTVFSGQYKSIISKNSDEIKAENSSAAASGAILGGEGRSVGQVAGSFGQTLQNELAKVNEIQMDASHDMEDYATGGDTPLHQVMISVNRAEISLQLATQVRNKLVSAYQDISRMQV